MYDFVTFNKKTGEITGYFRYSTNELLPEPRSPDEENLEVIDAKEIELLRGMDPRTMRPRGKVNGGKVQTLNAESIFRGRIELSCDLPDRDGNGVPELPADGEAVTLIRATLLGASNEVLTKEAATIRFRVDRGLLSHRQVNTEKGVAEVGLRSVPETVHIRVIAAAEGFEQANLELEIIPVEEYIALVKAGLGKAD